MKTAILAIILFCLMIFPHELGHFIAAKLNDIQVNEFSFGMGPAIWKKKRGETLHSIRLFPVGGYCAMEGEDGQDNEIPEGKGPSQVVDNDGVVEAVDSSLAKQLAYNPRSFNNKKPWQKIVVLLAGSVMNILTACIIMSLIVGITGFTTTKIDQVTEGSPAYKAGIMEGDRILAINDSEIKLWADVSSALNENQDKEAIVKIKRGSEIIETKLTPEKTEVLNKDGTLYGYRYTIGVTCKVSHNPLKAIKNGVISTWNITKIMYQSLGQIFTGEVGVEELSGPVGIVKLVSDTSSEGLWYFGFLVAMICVNLAVVNLLPLPALDGGRIIFVIYSWITGKKVSAKVEGIVHAVGLVLLLGLMVFVTWNDIVKLFS